MNFTWKDSIPMNSSFLKILPGPSVCSVSKNKEDKEKKEIFLGLS